jgi:hypothetical protein
MRSEIEIRMINKFLEIRSKHGNSIFAIEELDWLIFKKYKEQFWALSEEDQWEVRSVFGGLEKVHGK